MAIPRTRAEARLTRNLAGEPTRRPAPKVIAGASGAALGAALTTIAVYVIEGAARIDIPPAVEGAGSVVIVTGLAFLAGYIKRP